MSTSQRTIQNDVGEAIAMSHEIPIHRDDLDRLGGGGAAVSKGGIEFLYLDCGRWGGNGERYPHQRNFGVVWGRWALLCDFVTDGTPFPGKLNADAGPVNALLQALTEPGQSAVRIIKSEWVPPSPLAPEPSWDHIYVFLPDLHLPLVTRLPDPHHSEDDPHAAGRRFRTDGAPTGRFRYPHREDELLTPEQEQWFRSYLSSDIFQGAATDLVEFLEKLSRYRGDAKLKLVQVGDMYDLWIGLDRYFDVHADDAVLLSEQPDALGLSAQRFIDYWVGRTNASRRNGRAIRALHEFGDGRHISDWLYGNHDCYLGAHTPAGLPQRRKFLLERGLFAEHGHRGDASNRDGAKDGQFLTNEVFEYPFLRKLDPDRRQVFLEVAARLAVETALHSPEQAFCVYVMGHTHSGYLSRVRLSPSSFRVHANAFWLKNSVFSVLNSPFQK
jgi:UDP-2,3-diacylglucosamine pyrophosphatase LpxH